MDSDTSSSDSESCSSMSSDSSFSDCWMFLSESDSSDDCSDSSVVPDSPVKFDLPRIKRGRTSKAEQYPELVPQVTKFIQQHSSEAHNRRRESTALSHGVTLGDIQTHVKRTVVGLDAISTSTIHRLMQPTRKNTQNVKRHKGLVDARVPPKRNDKTKDHPDFHRTSASVRYAHELAFLCEDETVSLSCDDKNKINVGTLAVSRHFQIKRFFSQVDTPNYPDHDFPYRNSKLIPSGYMVLKRKRQSRSVSPPRREEQPCHRRSRSVSPERKSKHSFTDKTGRNRIDWPRSGPLTVYLQASRYHSSTSQSHACHLREILQPIVTDAVQPKSVVTIVADGGPDWSTKSTVNLIGYGRVWRDLKLDAFVLMAYAPGHSRFNPIERLWAPLSRWLTGVTLPVTLDGEDKPPCNQTRLSEKEREEKEVLVFDNAVRDCSKYWCNKSINSFPVKTVPVPSCSTVEASYTDHRLLKEFVDSSATAIRTKPEMKLLQEEYQFLIRHCVRRKYQVEFYKCTSVSCNHCTTNPIKAKTFFGILEQFNGKLPSPVLDNASSNGEYMTFQRLLNCPSYAESSLTSGDEEMCPLGCSYVFFSNLDKKRHNTLCHPRK